jgi:hypothetical protein
MRLLSYIASSFLFLQHIAGVKPYSPEHVSINSFVRKIGSGINADEVHVFEPKYINKKATECVVFFTGGAGYIPPIIYTSILSCISKRCLSVYVPTYDNKKIDELVNVLRLEYKDVILVSHSSGVARLIPVCENNEFIERAILIDPVDTRIIKFGKVFMRNIKNVLFVKSAKSYSGTPIPFIPPQFAMDDNSFQFLNKCDIEHYTDHFAGHCNLLNPVFSNIMHNIHICDGIFDRNSSIELYNYHERIGDIIYFFCKNISKDLVDRKEECGIYATDANPKLADCQRELETPED